MYPKRAIETHGLSYSEPRLVPSAKRLLPNRSPPQFVLALPQQVPPAALQSLGPNLTTTCSW